MPGGAVAIIPARFASTRLPGKPLLRETGKYLIQHVYERVRLAKKVQRVIVATDDHRIAQAVGGFGGEAMMTAKDHPNGTSRVAEVAKSILCDKVINVQGDEPDIDPRLIDGLVELLNESDMATLATPSNDLDSPARVKVVVDRNSDALYFTRSKLAGAFLHVGIYGYRKAFLLRLVRLPATPLEELEKLEQLRVLEHGHKIRVGIVQAPPFGGIDTPADYAAFVKRTAARKR